RDAVRDDCDAASARRVAELMREDARVQGRARALAAAAAAERAGAALARLAAAVRVRPAAARLPLGARGQGRLRHGAEPAGAPTARGGDATARRVQRAEPEQGGRSE